MEVLSSSSERYSQEILPVPIEVERPAGLIILGFILLHIPLSLVMLHYPFLSTVHAFTVLGVGVIACLIGRLDVAAAAAAYITGAEVLWRMTNASIFWEYGKYATLLICTIGIFRTGVRKISIPFLYFLLLVPSTIFTAEWSSFATARNELSFNLSGPLALFASLCFFSGKTLNRRQFGRILVSLVAPIIGIVSIAIYSTISASQINFTDESNRVTSGGYGPNQVSAMLGLGGLVLVLFIISIKANRFLKIAAGVLCAVLLSQSLLTFSRGGSYMALTGMAAAILIVIRKRHVVPFLFGMIIVAAIFSVWVLPWMNSFTGGTLEERYTDFQSSGRVDIVRDDLRIFKEHPFLGVGPGMAAGYRYLYYRGAAAHTEFSRMLAEHGLLGLAAIILLI
ncbi:O-antigen ligase family protein, partial [bacterium]|nr:O-antigen ligase family protein [bacterium]